MLHNYNRRNRFESGFDTDASIMKELEYYLYDESKLEGQYKSIIKNLERRVKRGDYDPNLAPKAWLLWVNAGATLYCKENNLDIRDTFPKSMRETLAEEIAENEFDKNSGYESKSSSFESNYDGWSNFETESVNLYIEGTYTGSKTYDYFWNAFKHLYASRKPLSAFVDFIEKEIVRAVGTSTGLQGIILKDFLEAVDYEELAKDWYGQVKNASARIR